MYIYYHYIYIPFINSANNNRITKEWILVSRIGCSCDCKAGKDVTLRINERIVIKKKSKNHALGDTASGPSNAI